MKPPKIGKCAHESKIKMKSKKHIGCQRDTNVGANKTLYMR